MENKRFDILLTRLAVYTALVLTSHAQRGQSNQEERFWKALPHMWLNWHGSPHAHIYAVTAVTPVLSSVLSSCFWGYEVFTPSRALLCPPPRPFMSPECLQQPCESTKTGRGPWGEVSWLPRLPFSSSDRDHDVFHFGCRKLEISSGRFARFADGSAVVQVKNNPRAWIGCAWRLDIFSDPYSS